jgi:hypothetical protein
VGSDEAVLGIHPTVGDVGQYPIAQAFVVGLVDGVVDLAPPDAFLRRGLADDELVLW